MTPFERRDMPYVIAIAVVLVIVMVVVVMVYPS